MLRLVRYQTPDGVRPGMLDDAGRVRDLSYVLIDIEASRLGPDDIDFLSAIEPETLPPVDAAVSRATPATGFGRVWLDGRALPDIEFDALAAAVGAGRNGAAAIVGAPGWANAIAAATLSEDAAVLSLGQVLVASETQREARAIEREVWGSAATAGSLRRALDSAKDAAPGDLVLLLREPGAPPPSFDRVR